jgi:hypothetical protein
VRRIVREYSASMGFEGNRWISSEWLYIPYARLWGVSLGIFESFLDILEPAISSLSHTHTPCLDIAFL